MKNFKFFIRFGVHKDREVIKSLRDSMSGMIVPAHILCYSSNATIAAISYVHKDYYIDPMTFLYSNDNFRDYVVLDQATHTNKFKPSIAKLTENYGLGSIFQKNGYKALKPENFSDDFSLSFCKKNIELQSKKVDSEKLGAYKKYSDLLKKIGENHIIQEMEALHTPKAIIPPYFYFKSLTDEWLAVNLKLAQLTKENTKLSVVPLIFTNPDCLNSDLLDKFKEFSELFVWIDDFEQKQSINGVQEKNFKKFADFIKVAEGRKVRIINMYGSYYSILLGKIGLGGMCNGVFYGESKGRKTKVGGVPPARYYIRKLHEFFIIPEAITLLKKYPDLLDEECNDCMGLINNNIDNIFAFNSNHSLAQEHFIYARKMELKDAQLKELTVLIKDLEYTYGKYKNLLSKEITAKNIEYLKIWGDALH